MTSGLEEEKIMRIMSVAALAAFVPLSALAQEPQRMGLNGSTSVINAEVQESIRSWRGVKPKTLHKGALCNLLTRDQVSILSEDATHLTVMKIRRVPRVSVTLNLKFWQYIPKTIAGSDTCPRNAKVKVQLLYKDALVKSWDAHEAQQRLKGGEKQ